MANQFKLIQVILRSGKLIAWQFFSAEINCLAVFFPDLMTWMPAISYKCQTSSSLVSSIKKRILGNLDIVPLCWHQGLNLGLSALKMSTLPLDLLKLPWKKAIILVNILWTQRSLHTKDIFQAGQLLWIFELLENSRPSASYYQLNS